MGRGGDVLPRRGARRRLLQPLPDECRLVGTRRWAPGNTLAAVEAEFRELLEPIAAETGCSIELDLRLVRERLLDRSRASALGRAAGRLRGRDGRRAAAAGIKVVADAACLPGRGGIPAVYHGPAGSGAHGDVEFMPVAELVRATQVYLRMLQHLWAA